MKQLIVLILFTSLIFCTKENNSIGYLGIRVPTGEGKVTDETPYIISEILADSPHWDKFEPGDIIIQIDSNLLDGLKYNYIYDNFLRKKVGTKMTFRIKRKSEEHIMRLIQQNKRDKKKK